MAVTAAGHIRFTSFVRFIVPALVVSLGTGQDALASAPRHVVEGYVRADDGVRLFYRRVGTRGPVVIVPGGLFLERDFERLGGYARVVFYDMRNRGRSETVHDSTRLSIDQEVRDLEAVRRHLGTARVALIGWSYLGMMVMRYAAEHRTHVTRIIQLGPLARRWGTAFPDSLTAHDTVPVPDSASLAELARAQADSMPARDPRGFCELDYRVNRVRLVGSPEHAPQVPDLCAMSNEWPTVLSTHFRWLFTSFVTTEPPAWACFSALAVPVLTIHGTKDRNAPYGGGLEWAAHLRNARLLTIRGAAHMLWLDAPSKVFGAIRAFLHGAWPPDAHRPRRIDATLDTPTPSDVCNSAKLE